MWIWALQIKHKQLPTHPEGLMERFSHSKTHQEMSGIYFTVKHKVRKDSTRGFETYREWKLIFLGSPGGCSLVCVALRSWLGWQAMHT